MHHAYCHPKAFLDHSVERFCGKYKLMIGAVSYLLAIATGSPGKTGTGDLLFHLQEGVQKAASPQPMPCHLADSTLAIWHSQ